MTACGISPRRPAVRTRRASDRMRNSVELARLRRELDQAVAGEDYERAAKLRDQIKALPAEGGAP